MECGALHGQHFGGLALSTCWANPFKPFFAHLTHCVAGVCNAVRFLRRWRSVLHSPQWMAGARCSACKALPYRPRSLALMPAMPPLTDKPQVRTLLLTDLVDSTSLVERIGGGRWCTVTDRSRFFSYRRDGVTGRMAAAVWIERG